MKTVGIIGFGSFGAFAAEKLRGNLSIRVFDPHKNVSAEMSAELAAVCATDYLMLAIPLSAYEQVLSSIKPLLSEQTIVVDISSVKVEPIRLMSSILPGQPYIATHPLFGPESAGDNLSGHTVIFCEHTVADAELENVQAFCKELGLEVEEMSADEHDKQMAIVQGLTFFVSRALNRYGLHEMKFKTPSFQRLLHLAELDNSHTDELMNTILVGNKYALAARQKFMADIEALNAEINHRP